MLWPGKPNQATSVFFGRGGKSRLYLLKQLKVVMFFKLRLSGYFTINQGGLSPSLVDDYFKLNT